MMVSQLKKKTTHKYHHVASLFCCFHTFFYFKGIVREQTLYTYYTKTNL